MFAFFSFIISSLSVGFWLILNEIITIQKDQQNLKNEEKSSNSYFNFLWDFLDYTNIFTQNVSLNFYNAIMTPEFGEAVLLLLLVGFSFTLGFSGAYAYNEDFTKIPIKTITDQLQANSYSLYLKDEYFTNIKIDYNAVEHTCRIFIKGIVEQEYHQIDNIFLLEQFYNDYSDQINQIIANIQ